MGLPLVTEEAEVGIDVRVLVWILRAGFGGAVLREGAGVVLGPEAVEGEGETLGALGCVGVGVAELGGPGEIEEIVVEVLWAGRLRDGSGGSRLTGGCLVRWLRLRVARGHEAHGKKKREEQTRGSLRHGGSSISGERWAEYRTLRDFYEN